MKLELISSDEASGENMPTYLLQTRRGTDGTRETRLYREGTLLSTSLQKSVPEGLLEQEFEEGQKRRETLYAGGLPRYRLEIEEDSEVREYTYHWEDGRLVSITERSGDEEVRSDYFSAADGSLRQVRREVDREVESTVSYTSAAEGSLLAEWHTANGSIDRLVYREGGGYSLISYMDGKVVKRRSTVPVDGGERVEEIHYESGERTVERYNERGSLVEKIQRGEEGLRRERYRYEDGRLVEKLLRSPKTDRRIRYFYDDAGELEMEEVFLASKLSRRVRYENDRRRVETVYRMGEAVYREIYRGEELVSRERIP